eukprot:12644238-Heterocapsa_arctica.AAC.1
MSDESGVGECDVPDRGVGVLGDPGGAGQGCFHDFSEVNPRDCDAGAHEAHLAAEDEVGVAGGRCQVSQ